jgi:flagellar biosynthesis chaperone FliJ
VATLRKVIQERKKYLRHLKFLLKNLDTSLEQSERRIKQIISRKNKVPETEDLYQLTTMSKSMITALNEFVGALNKGYVE